MSCFSLLGEFLIPLLSFGRQSICVSFHHPDLVDFWLLFLVLELKSLFGSQVKPQKVGNSDQNCWQRPEDMTTSRVAYKIDPDHPESDLAGETAAAMAAASVIFRRYNSSYSAELLKHADQLFDFADKYRGKSDSSIRIPKKYYNRSVSGYADELLWAAAWLYKATNNEYYLNYLGNQIRTAIVSDGPDGGTDATEVVAGGDRADDPGDRGGDVGGDIGGGDRDDGDIGGGHGATATVGDDAAEGGGDGRTAWAIAEFGWDVKYAGVQTLVAKFLMAGKGGNFTPVFEKYQEKAEIFMCSCIGKNTSNAQKTPGGLIFRQRRNNMQFVTSASFLMTVYSDYLTSAGKSLHCAKGNVTPSELLSFAKSQVDYILGDNPRAMSYMVGYGKNYPQQVHHRAASIMSYKVDPSFVSCRGGYADWFNRKTSNPNILTGAIVGGPDAYDNFTDQRDNYEQTEPATYNNAPLIGVLARLHAGHGDYNQLLPVELPALEPVATNPKPSEKPGVNPGPASTTNPISISQKVTNSWVDNGKTFYRYSVIVTNKSSKNLKNLKLYISNLHGPLWGLTKSGDYYFFPEWIDTLAAGKSLEFVYIHPASPAKVSVSSYSLL